MLKVGLTGGISVGKSHVSQAFRELGCHVFDADQIARDVVLPGTVGYEKVIAEFGKEVLNAQAEIDRARLGEIIFNDLAKRQRLNEILHPIIITEQDRLLREVEIADPKGIAIIDAALMIESGSYRRFDKIIVVYCAAEEQIQRLMQRNNISRVAAQARIAAQMPTAEKRKYADFEIDTSGSVEQTRMLVKEVHAQLLKLAALPQ